VTTLLRAVVKSGRGCVVWTAHGCHASCECHLPTACASCSCVGARGTVLLVLHTLSWCYVCKLGSNRCCVLTMLLTITLCCMLYAHVLCRCVSSHRPPPLPPAAGMCMVRGATTRSGRTGSSCSPARSPDGATMHEQQVWGGGSAINTTRHHVMITHHCRAWPACRQQCGPAAWRVCFLRREHHAGFACFRLVYCHAMCVGCCVSWGGIKAASCWAQGGVGAGRGTLWVELV
jgi:hypothetical protein